MPSKKLKIIIVPAFLLLILFTIFILLLGPLVNYTPVQRFLLGELSKATGYELRTSKIDVSLWRGLEIDVYDLMARPKSGPERITASIVKIHLDPKEILNRRVVPDKVFLFRPKIEMAVQKGWTSWRPRDGGASFFEEVMVKRLGELFSLSMQEAQVSIKGLPFKLEDLRLEMFQENKVPIRLRTSLDGEFVFKKERARFTLKGAINADEQNPGDLYAEMTLKTGKFPIAWVPWPNFLPVEEGVAEADIEFKGTLGRPVSAKGKIIATDNRFSVIWRERKKDYSFDCLLFDFDSLYSQKTLEIPSLRLCGPDFFLSIKSRLDFHDISNPHLEVRVKSPFVPESAFKRVFPTPFVKPWVEERLFPIITGGDGRLDLFSLNGTLDQIKNLRSPENAEVLSMKISWKDVEVSKHGVDLPFERVSGKLDFEKRVLSVWLENAVFGNSTINCASLNVSRPSGVRTYRLLVDGQFDLNDLKQQQKIDFIPAHMRQALEKIKYMSGRLGAWFEVGFEHGWVNTRVLNGNFRFRDCSIAHHGLLLPLELIEADLETNGEETLIHAAKMRVGKSVMDMEGRFRNGDGLKGELAVNFDNLNFLDFKTDETGFRIKELDQDPFIKKADIRLNLNARKAEWSKLRYSPIHARCIFRAGDFYVEQATLQMEHGVLTVKGHVKNIVRAGDFYVEQATFQMEHGVLTVKGHVKNIEGPEKLFFTSEIKIANQPVNDLLRIFGLKKQAFEGALTIEATLRAKGREKKDLISGLTGSAYFHMEKGRIRKKGIVFKVLDVLSIQNIYKGRLPDFLKEGFYFEDIEGHFDIAGGILKTEDLTMKSPVFNAVALGKVIPDKKKVNFVVWVQTLETIDAFVSRVPIIGYILTGKENAPKGVVVYPVEVKGHWSDPEVKYLPSLKKLGGGVVNIFKRILLTPGHIFKEISEMTGVTAKGETPVPEEGSELNGSIIP